MMAPNIPEIGSMIQCMDTVSLTGLMAKSTKDSGHIICSMDKAYLSGQTVNVTEDNIKTTRKVDRESCHGLMESAFWEFGVMENISITTKNDSSTY